MVDAGASLKMGREVIAAQPFKEKLCAIAQGTIAKLANKNETTP